MTSEEMEKAILSEIDADPEAFSEASVCMIDPNTRVITVPASLSLFGTESDEKTNRLTFRCPRVVGDNVDLSNFQICINFRNANSEKDRYIVEDMMIDGDEITFSWSLSRKVTKYKGRVSFIVCALNSREGTIVNEWNTTLAFGTVLEGLEADVVNLDEEEKDIILQLLAMVDEKSSKAISDIHSAAESEKQQIAQKGAETIESIPDDYNALVTDVSGLKGDIVNLNITYNSQYINPNGWEIGKAYYKGSSTRVDSTANELLKCIKIESLKIGTYHYRNINPGFTCIQKKSNNIVETLKELTSSDLLNGKFTVDESFDMYITTNSSFESNDSMLCDGDFPSDFVFGIYGRLYDGCDLSKLDEEIIKSKFPNLYGKKWCCVGDSITDHAIPNVTYYDTLIANDTGIIPTNLGVAGTGYRREEGNGNCFYQRIESGLPTDCEYVTIMGSINDSIHNLGTPTDESTTDTVCGRINLAINKVFEKIPNAKLGLISPLPASTQNPNNDNCFIANLVVAQKEICRLRGIPYLDLFHSSNLRPWDSAQNDIFNEHNESSNVHPLTNGYLIFYRRILDFINSL